MRLSPVLEIKASTQRYRAGDRSGRDRFKLQDGWSAAFVDTITVHIMHTALVWIFNHHENCCGDPEWSYFDSSYLCFLWLTDLPWLLYLSISRQLPINIAQRVCTPTEVNSLPRSSPQMTAQNMFTKSITWNLSVDSIFSGLSGWPLPCYGNIIQQNTPRCSPKTVWQQRCGFPLSNISLCVHLLLTRLFPEVLSSSP